MFSGNTGGGSSSSSTTTTNNNSSYSNICSSRSCGILQVVAVVGIVTVEFVVVIMMVTATGTVVVLAEVDVVGTVLLFLVVVATAASALGEGRTSFRADVIVYSSSHVASSFTMSSCGLEL